MLLADDGQRSLLYTGDFKLDASATAEAGRVAARGYSRHGIDVWPAPLSLAAARGGRRPTARNRVRRTGRWNDARRPRLSARQVAGSHEAANVERRARAATSGRVRSQPHLRRMRRRSGRLRPVRGPAARTATRSSRCRGRPANFGCRGLAKRFRSPSPVGRRTKPRSIASASITRCRCPTTPITISSSKPCGESSRERFSARTARPNSPTISATWASTPIRSTRPPNAGCFARRAWADIPVCRIRTADANVCPTACRHACSLSFTAKDLPAVTVIRRACPSCTGYAVGSVRTASGRADFAGCRPVQRSNSDFTDRSRNDGDSGSRERCPRCLTPHYLVGQRMTRSSSTAAYWLAACLAAIRRPSALPGCRTGQRNVVAGSRRDGRCRYAGGLPAAGRRYFRSAEGSARDAQRRGAAEVVTPARGE